MKTFVVPTDFSDVAKEALLYACHLAKESDAQLIILNCYRLPSSQSLVMIDLKDILEKDSISGLSNQIALIRERTEFNQIQIITESFYGFLAEGLDYIIKKHTPDLVIMGTTGANSLGNKILGSNTTHVIKKIKTPILVVPEKAEWEKWSNVVIASDFHFNGEVNSIKQVKKIVNGMKVNLDVLHVLDKTHSENNFEKSESQMLSLLEESKVAFYYEPAENITEGIISFIQKHDLDLLVMFKRKHGFLEQLFQQSATKNLALHSTCPVLLLNG